MKNEKYEEKVCKRWVRMKPMASGWKVRVVVEWDKIWNKNEKKDQPKPWIGIEPMTSGLQAKRSTHWATQPTDIHKSYDHFIDIYKIF